MKIDVRDIPPPPSEDSGGQSCDGGNCDTESVGWRYYVTDRVWLPVCARHIGSGVPPALKRYDEPAR